MSRKSTRHFTMDSLESRMLLSAQVIGYLPDYQRAKMVSSPPTVGQPDWSGMTQLNYFSFRPEVFVTSATPSSTSSGGTIALMDSTVAAARAANPNIKVNIVLGGANHIGDAFPDIARNSSSTFINNLKTFCAAHGFDGVDFDWEPEWGTAQQTDIDSYGGLIQAFKAAAPNLELSAAVAPNKVPVTGGTTPGYVIPQAATASLDYLNVMAYDYNLGAAHSPRQDAKNSIDGWATYTAGRLTPSQLLLGVPFYGRDSIAWSDDHVRTYGQIVTNWGPQSTDESHGFHFNGPATILDKSQYAMSHNYGGVMVWDISQDYFTPGTLQYDANLSLLPIIKNTVLGSTPTDWATLNSGVLIANGTSGDDVFTIGVSGSNISITRGSSTMNFAASAVNSITITGTGGDDTLEFNGPIPKPVVFNGGTGFDTLNVNAGTFTFANDANAGNSALVVNVAAGASVVFNATQHLDGVNVLGTATMSANGSRVLVTNGLSIGAAGKVDLNDNDMIVNYDGATVKPAIQSLINAARGANVWTGNGLTSTAARNRTPKITTLGVLEASEFKSLPGNANAKFANETIDNTSVLIKYTYYGDVDFSGRVNFDDYARVDAGFNNRRTGWMNGDLNGDGAVNFDDYGLIDLAYNNQGTTALRPSPSPIKPKSPGSPFGGGSLQN